MSDLPESSVVPSPLPKSAPVEPVPNSGIALIQKSYFPYSALSLSWAKEEKGVLTTLYTPQTCRTRLHDFWYRSNKNSKYSSMPSGSSDIPTDKEKAVIYFHLGNVGESEASKKRQVLKNLESLNELEKKYGIAPTKVDFVSVQDKMGKQYGYGAVFTGDNDWQSNLWKISIYSFLLKATCLTSFLRSRHDDIVEYGRYLRENEEAFLSKVKTVFEEHFTSEEYTYIHVYSGFVSICTGDNPKMRELLIGEKNVG